MKKAHKLKGKVDFGIITITEKEYVEVQELLDDYELVDGTDLRYRFSSLDCDNGTGTTVAVTRSPDPGTVEAQQVTTELISDLAPKWIMVVGMAGGIPSDDFSLGDVILATRVHDFTLQ